MSTLKQKSKFFMSITAIALMGLSFACLSEKVKEENKPQAPQAPQAPGPEESIYCIGDRIADAPAAKCKKGTDGPVRLQCQQGAVACEKEVLGLEPKRCYTPQKDGPPVFNFTECKDVADKTQPTEPEVPIYCIGDRIADVPATKCKKGTEGPVKLQCKQGTVACEKAVPGLDPKRCYTPQKDGPPAFNFTECKDVAGKL